MYALLNRMAVKIYEQEYSTDTSLIHVVILCCVPWSSLLIRAWAWKRAPEVFLSQSSYKFSRRSVFLPNFHSTGVFWNFDVSRFTNFPVFVVSRNFPSYNTFSTRDSFHDRVFLTLDFKSSEYTSSVWPELYKSL